VCSEVLSADTLPLRGVPSQLSMIRRRSYHSGAQFDLSLGVTGRCTSETQPNLLKQFAVMEGYISYIFIYSQLGRAMSKLFETSSQLLNIADPWLGAQMRFDHGADFKAAWLTLVRATPPDYQTIST
jgi:hypothetical protein